MLIRRLADANVVAYSGNACYKKLVYAQGIYAGHRQPETFNATDNVFNDSIADEMEQLPEIRKMVLY